MRVHSKVFLFSFLFFSYGHGEQQELHIYHRVVHPNLPVTPWSELGFVVLPPQHSMSPLGTPAELVTSDAVQDDLSEFSLAVDPAIEDAMYQVSLERADVPDALWPVSTVKTCFMPSSTSSNLTIHLSSSGIPFAVDYFVSPVPHDGLCPQSSDTRKTYPAHNSTVVLKSPRLPPQPELRAPLLLAREGEPIAPIPEKSFVQKYWIYIAIALAVLLIAGPADEPATSSGASGGK
ncbi:hypothetical protein F5I97DRAFT_862320 [Phlebopus sp. FC_14]|nr:hypothetical protein F5I97DRAFT_862320 [Phlebopus sp. FC_14]